MPEHAERTIITKNKITYLIAAVIAVSCMPYEMNIFAEETSVSTAPYEFLDMPVISITSSGSISSKDSYTSASVAIYNEDGTVSMEETPVSARLRGNSSLSSAKKSYKLKFETKVNPLETGDGSAKTWNLVANSFDTSMLRNKTAYAMGDMLDGMSYSPNSQNVEVYLNGQYQGVYLLCEAVSISKSRINIEENTEETENTGYLVEMTRYASENYFDIDLERYEIKNDLSDDSEIRNAQTDYISGYIEKCSQALRSGSREEAEKYIDLDSLTDIYIASEIVKNVDAGWDSFYMFKDAGGKLEFGPLWDFDLALGNFIDTKSFDKWAGLNIYDCVNISSNSNPWFVSAVSCDWFREMVTERWNEKISELSTLDELVSEEAQENIRSYEKNCSKWNTLGKQQFSEPETIWGLKSYSEHAEYLSDWVENRVNWLDKYFNSDDFSDGILLDEDGKQISDDDVNIAEYSTNFVMFASDFELDDTPSVKAKIGSGWASFFQLCMSGVMAEKDAEYLVSFDCSADTEGAAVTWKLQQNYGSYSVLNSEKINAETETVHYEGKFTSDVFDTNCAFVIEGSGKTGTEITVSNIILKKISSSSAEKITGDINEDGKVTASDLSLLVQYMHGLKETAVNSDINSDGTVNIADLIELKNIILSE